MDKNKNCQELEVRQVMQRKRMVAAKDSTKALLEHYEDIAPKYDQFIELDGWMDGRREIAAVLHRTIPDTNARILDCGCGTGHTALEIKNLGFTNIDGLDMSSHMLEEGKRKGVFQNVICGMISIDGERSEIPNDSYDAVVCNGVFLEGHMDQRCFPELTRITKSGGYIIFSVSYKYLQEYNMFANGRLDEAIERCVSVGQWETVNKEVRPYWRNEEAVIYAALVA